MDLVKLPVSPLDGRVSDDKSGQDGGGPTLHVLEDLRERREGGKEGGKEGGRTRE